MIERESKRRKVENNDPVDVNPHSMEKMPDTYVQTELTQQDLVSFQFQVESLQSDVKELRSAALSKEAFEENDSLVAFYTGLSNWETFSVF